MCAHKRAEKSTHAFQSEVALRGRPFPHTDEPMKQSEDGGVSQRLGAGSRAPQTHVSGHIVSKTQGIFLHLPPYQASPRDANPALEQHDTTPH